MGDTAITSNRKRKYINSFSNVSQAEAELILGFKFVDFYDSQIPVEQFINKTAPEQLKKAIFERLSDCIESEGFPEATIYPLNESVITDNVGVILQAIVSYCRVTNNRNDLRLIREKQIISIDEQFGENMEFVRMQAINVDSNRYMIVVEAKRDSLGKGLTHLLLALKSMWNINNDQKLVYGFITTAIDWQLIIYDGETWKLSERTTVLLPNMRKKQDRWLTNNTQLLDVVYSILSSI